MNLYYIEQGEDYDYENDTFDSAVVAANSEEEARMIHPDSEGKCTWNGVDHFDIWTTPDKVKVTLIGIAAADVCEGTVISSFNAGEGE